MQGYTELTKGLKLAVNLKTYLKKEFPDLTNKGYDYVRKLTQTSNNLRGFINVKEYGAKGDNSADDRPSLMAAIEAGRNGRIFIPSGRYKISSAITLDPSYSYDIYGEGYDNDGSKCTVIYNAGTGNAISCEDPSNLGTNNLLAISNLCIAGSSSSQHGIYLNNIHSAKLSNIWSRAHGYNGVYLYDCWACKLDHVWSTVNGHDGINITRRGNQVTLLNCVANSNSRSTGYANLRITGASSYENLGVTVIGCDFSYAGIWAYSGTIAEAYNIIVQHTFGSTFIGNYSEWAITQLLYSDSTSKNLVLLGNYFQDGDVSVEYSPRTMIWHNVFNKVGVDTDLNVDGYIQDRISVVGNMYNGGATESLAGSFTRDKIRAYDTAAPVSGTWEVNDIVYNSTPAAGEFIGWVCVSAGTPGTWKGYGAIEA